MLGAFNPSMDPKFPVARQARLYWLFIKIDGLPLDLEV